MRRNNRRGRSRLASRRGRSARRAGGAGRNILEQLRSLFAVEWSLGYIGFLLYIFVIITYRVSLGDVAVGAAFIGVLISRRRTRFPPYLLAFVLFVAWVSLGQFIVPFKWLVRGPAFELSKLVIISFVAVNVLRTPKQIRLFMALSVLFFAMYPARGAIFNYAIYGHATLGRAVWNYIYENPNDLASLTLLQLSIAAALLVREPPGIVKKGALAAVVVLPLLIFMTQSRGAFLALGFAGLLALTAGRRKLRTLAVVGLIAGVVVLAAPSSVWERFSGLSFATDTERLEQVDEEGSAKSRFEIWRIATWMISDYPLTGVGFGAYQMAHAIYSDTEEAYIGAFGFKDTHSTYLNTLAETGYPGLILFLTILALVFVKAETVRRKVQRMSPRSAASLFYLELGLVAFLTAGIFASFNKLSFLYIHMALLFALAVSVDQMVEAERRRQLRRRRARQGSIRRTPRPTRTPQGARPAIDAARLPGAE